MTREQIRAYVLANPLNWPALRPEQRVRLAVLLRPDLPVGIDRHHSTVREAESPPEAA